ncbi:MAG: GNAT family N-acetyltransferase [Ktedonobacterales bacterium]|nr:GNAT family N-acetyltransferase [Ktedonobacterales bacterium]
MNILLLPNYTLHAPTPADVPEVLALLAASDTADYGEANTTDPEEVQRWWVREETTLVRDAAGHLIAYYSLSADDPTHYYSEVFVHPDQRGQGLEGAILDRLEARARERLADSPVTAQWLLESGIGRHSVVMRAALAEHSYGYIRTFWRMRIDLTAPPPTPEWPQGIILRTYQPGTDDRAVYDAVETAFADHWNWHATPFEEWIERTQRPNFDPALWLLAMDGTAIAGAALGTKELTKGWINKVAVPRAYRKRGIAKALLYQAFGAFWQRDVRRVELGVDAESLTGAQRLYEQVGMHPVMEYDLFQKELRAASPPDPEPRMQEL